MNHRAMISHGGLSQLSANHVNREETMKRKLAAQFLMFVFSLISALCLGTGISRADDTLHVSSDALEIQIGSWITPAFKAEIGLGQGTVERGSIGLSADLVYIHRFTHLLSMMFGTSLHRIECSTEWWGESSHAVSWMVGIMIGPRFNFPVYSNGQRLESFVFLTVGPLFAFQATQLPTVEDPYSITEVAARAGIGLDYDIGYGFGLGATGSYFRTSNFRRQIAGADRFSSLDLELTFRYTFGSLKR